MKFGFRYWYIYFKSGNKDFKFTFYSNTHHIKLCQNLLIFRKSEKNRSDSSNLVQNLSKSQ